MAVHCVPSAGCDHTQAGSPRFARDDELWAHGDDMCTLGDDMCKQGDKLCAFGDKLRGFGDEVCAHVGQAGMTP